MYNNTDSINTSSNSQQIIMDQKLSYQLFEESNLRDPISQVPVFLSDNGMNPALNSMRQIMAEQMAEENQRERFKKQRNTKPKNSASCDQMSMPKKTETISTGLYSTTKDESKHMANVVKLRHLYEKYENLVDRQMLEKILKDFK